MKKIIIFLFVILLAGGGFGFYKYQSEKESRACERALNESKNRFQKYILGSYESEYEDLTKKCESAIQNDDPSLAKKIQNKINKLETTVQSENRKMIDADYKKLEQEDVSNAFDEELKEIEDYKNQISKNRSEHNYIKSQNYLKKWTDLVKIIQTVYNNLSMNIEQVDTSNYPNVKIYVDIKNNVTGEVPKNLNKKYFILKEKTEKSSDFTRQTVITAKQLDENEPLNTNMVADISGSMQGSLLSNAQTVMKTFLDSVQFNIGDQVELTTFSTGVQTAVEFTKDKSQLVTAIDNFATNDMTSLYDALFAAINTTAIQDGAKCVVAFTDGKDNYSQCKPQDVIDLANKYKIPVFIIGIGTSLDTSYIQSICDETGGFYRNITDVNSMKDIYSEIYRKQKELYCVEYKVTSKDITTARDIHLDFQNRKIGGTSSTSYTPSILMSAKASTVGLSAPELVMHNYLNNFIKAINTHDFSYIEKYLMKDGPVYKETKEYIKRDIKEDLLSYNFLGVEYLSDNTCNIHMNETYKIQNQKEPLHMRTIDSYYQLKKQSDGSWKIYMYPDEMTIIQKIKY